MAAHTQTRLGKYELIAELGHGGMADVFLAIARGPAGLGFNKLFVLKKLRDHLARDHDFVTMLVDEARIAARLNHPNVVQTVEIGNVEGEYFLAMEYLDGQPLRRILLKADGRGGMPRPLRYLVISDALSGLEHAHTLQDFDGSPLRIVHRDVSPHNVFVTYDGQVKVMDFGIAKAVGRISETRHGVIKGKAPYMAPEQALGAPLDRRADIYAAGVMLWEAATGRRMWEGKSDPEVLSKLIRGTIPYSPIEVNPEVPRRLDEICRKALAFVVENRYESAAALQGDLDDYLAESGARASNRELGKYVAELFAEHRSEAKTIIESRLAQLNAMSPASMRTVPLAALRAPSVGNEHPVSEGSIPIEVETDSRVETSSTLASAPLEEQLPPVGRRLLRLGALGITAIAALLIATWSWVHSTASTDAKEPARAQASSSPSTQASDDIWLILRAEPQETRFSVDDGPLLDNPYSGRFRRDDAPHTVRAEAPGYFPKTQAVHFDDDRSLRFSLARSDKGPTHAGSSSP